MWITNLSRVELTRNPDDGQYVIRLADQWVNAPDGRPLLSKRCTNLQELDAEIDTLKGELDSIKEAAHRRWGIQPAVS